MQDKPTPCTTSVAIFCQNLIDRVPTYAYDFRHNRIPGEFEGQEPYWRDVGTLDALYEANMDLRNTTPALNLYNYRWPIRAGASTLPAAKFNFNEDGRRGMALQSIIAEGCIVSGGTVIDSVLAHKRVCAQLQPRGSVGGYG